MPVLILGISVAVVQYQKQQDAEMSDTMIANLEALAGEGDTEGGGDEKRPPEWWDFFNNYEEVEKIPITTVGEKYAFISVKGFVVGVSEEIRYTLCIYHHCYDGGDRDECTSSHVHGYR